MSEHEAFKRRDSGDCAEVERLRAALQAVIDYRPPQPYPGDTEWAAIKACPDCQRWASKEHHPQNTCDKHYVMLRRFEEQRDAERRFAPIAMRDIARAALHPRTNTRSKS